MYQQFLPQTAQAYIEAYRTLAALTEAAMESYVKTLDPASGDAARGLQRLAEAVETLSGLRGDNEIYYGARPDGLVEFQHEMYEIEYALRKRLVDLGYVYPRH